MFSGPQGEGKLRQNIVVTRGNWRPAPTSDATSASMRSNRRTGTIPERRLRSELHRRGLRFRVDYPIQVGGRRVRPDLVFRARRVAVFVDGCFWHGCPEHGSLPKANSDYWTPKLLRTVERDREVSARLKSAGWTVLRIWEHEDVSVAAEEVQRVVGQ
jgi:DNA mismatch endonuclease, patch repair protein